MHTIIGGVRMKKIAIISCFALLLTFLVGCGIKDNSSGNTTNPTNPVNMTNPANTTVTELPKVQDYYPIKENNRYIYEGKGNEYAAFNVYNDYTTGDKVQQRVDNGGTEAAYIIELKDGKATRALIRSEMYYRENLLQQESPEKEVLLMEPLEKGTKWTLKDGGVRIITNTSSDVITPTGSYKAIEVTTTRENDKTIDYYAKNIGLVQSLFISGETEVSSTLSKIEENVYLKQKINFYFPNINDDKIYYESKEVGFKTNDITKQVLEKDYKEVASSNTVNVLTSNTKINSLYLNKDNMVYIDLNGAFLKEINAGALYEKNILQSIANTFGQYYNSEKVVLTIDNKLYKSGHISMKKGEYIRVKYEGTLEIKSKT